MEDGENSGGNFGGRFHKIIQDELSTDENASDSSMEKQQVSMSMAGAESTLSHYKVLTVCLVVLAVILLSVDIGLGVFYYKLTDGLYLVKDINSELAKLHASYNTAVQNRDDAKKELEKAISDQQVDKWEIEHLSKTCQSYEKDADKLQVEIATMKSHLPMLKEGCRHCLAGWTFVNSACYYFAFSGALVRRSWYEARDFCKRQGGDLAVIDSREKNLVITELINKYAVLMGPAVPFTGFWIGLRDVDDEGTWKWLDGTPLTDSFWNIGEPNNQGNEDCAATYRRSNPFFAWNDAPCSHGLKWICEMIPRLIS